MWTPKLVDEAAQDYPRAARCGHRSAEQRPAGRPGDRSRYGVAAWASLPQTIDDTLYDAFGQRQVSTMFTQLNQYHVVLEVDPQFPAESRIRSRTFT